MRRGLVELSRIAWSDCRGPILFVLGLDLVLLGLFLRWAYVSHFVMIGDPLYGDRRFSMTDGSAIEYWGYAKQATAVVLLCLIGRHRPSLFLAAFALVCFVALADDLLLLHESLGGSIGALTEWGGAVAELVALGLIGGGPVLLTVIGFGRLPRSDRVDGVWLALPLVALIGFAGLADLIHAMLLSGRSGGRTLATLIEDGGELLAMSALVIAAVTIWRNRDRTAVAERVMVDRPSVHPAN